MGKSSGYREHEHTADWELEVWAPNYEALFEQAARGMFAICGARCEPNGKQLRCLKIEAVDYESLLVSFLQELLYIAEMEGLLFETYNLTVDQYRLQANLVGAFLASIDKEIKAVTYHNLRIISTQDGLQVRIVFDV
jgi:SHS2 domain-containing protein